MGQAFLELYEATADRQYLARTQSAADFIATHFHRPGTVGIVTSDSPAADLQTADPLAAAPEYDENVDLARFANLLSQYTGRSPDRKLADAAMMYVATPQIAHDHGIQVAGALLADDELSRPALHIVIVGKKSDPKAADLFAAAPNPDGV